MISGENNFNIQDAIFSLTFSEVIVFQHLPASISLKSYILLYTSTEICMIKGIIIFHNKYNMLCYCREKTLYFSSMDRHPMAMAI